MEVVKMPEYWFDHIHLRSPDPVKTAEFYEQMFGAKRVSMRDEGDGRAMVKLDLKGINSQLAETMKTHLILDLDKFGVWEDDYQTFIGERAKAVSNELKKRIVSQDIDKVSQTAFSDDYDESALELVELGK